MAGGDADKRTQIEIERAAPIAAPPSLQLEPCMRDQYLWTGATTTSVGAPARAPATTRSVEFAVMVVFTALTSMMK
jgi:hypothetical protein